jgi:metal-responsive CopG/Arc/MetJ family transcriptional regulator
MSDKLKPVIVRLELDLIEKLDRAADNDGRSRAGMIRKFCHQAVAGLDAASIEHRSAAA